MSEISFRKSENFKNTIFNLKKKHFELEEADRVLELTGEPSETAQKLFSVFSLKKSWKPVREVATGPAIGTKDAVYRLSENAHYPFGTV